MLDNEGDYGIWKGVPGLHFAIKDQLRLFQTLACLEVSDNYVNNSNSSLSLSSLSLRLFIVLLVSFPPVHC